MYTTSFCALIICFTSSLMSIDPVDNFLQGLHNLFFPRNDSLEASSQKPYLSSNNRPTASPNHESDPGDLETKESMENYIREICGGLYRCCSDFHEKENANLIIDKMRRYVHDVGGMKFISKNRVDELINSRVVEFFEQHSRKYCNELYGNDHVCRPLGGRVREKMKDYVLSRSAIDAYELMRYGLLQINREINMINEGQPQNYGNSSNNPPYNPAWVAEQERLKKERENQNGQPAKTYPTDECPVCMESFGDRGVERLFIACGHNLCSHCKDGCNHVCPLCRASY